MSRKVPLSGLRPRWVHASLRHPRSVHGVFGPPPDEDGEPKSEGDMGQRLGVAFDYPLCDPTHPVSVPIVDSDHPWFQGFPGPWQSSGDLKSLTIKPSIWINKQGLPGTCSLHCWVTDGQVEIL